MAPTIGKSKYTKATTSK